MAASFEQNLERARGSQLAEAQPWVVCGAMQLALFSGLDLALAPGHASLRAHAAAWAVGALAGAWMGALTAAVLLTLRGRTRRVQLLVWPVLGLTCSAILVKGLAVRANWSGPFHDLAQLCLAASLLAGLAIAAVGIAIQPRPTAVRGSWGNWRREYRAGAVLQALLGAALATFADRLGLVVEYPLALLALRCTAFALLLIACVQSLHVRPAGGRYGPLWAAAALGVLVGASAWLTPSPVPQVLAGRPYCALALDTLSLGPGRLFARLWQRDEFAALPCSTQSPPSLTGNMAPPVVPSPVSVVYITVDTVGAERLGIYGASRPVSPNVDRWARERALVFDNAFTSGSSTAIALASAARGVYARRLQWTRTARTQGGAYIPLDDPKFAERTAEDAVERTYLLPIHDRHPTLSETLSHRGMRTLAVSSVHFFQPVARIVGQFDTLQVLDGGNSKVPDDAGATRTALGWLSELGQDKPYFLWVHYLGPHSPSTRNPKAPVFGNGVSAWYDHEIATFDLNVAPLLMELSARQDRGERVVVILSADHGEEVAQHRFHGHLLNDRVMRVPYLVSLPGLSPRRSSVPISSLDTFPTVLSMTQTATQQGLDGKDLTAVFAGGALPPRVVLGDAWVVDMANNLAANIVVATDGQRAYTSNLRTGAADLLQLDDERNGKRGRNLLEQAAPGVLRTELELYLGAQGSDPRTL